MKEIVYRVTQPLFNFSTILFFHRSRRLKHDYIRWPSIMKIKLCCPRITFGLFPSTSALSSYLPSAESNENNTNNAASFSLLCVTRLSLRRGNCNDAHDAATVSIVVSHCLDFEVLFDV
jgi:hypothetical protein